MYAHVMRACISLSLSIYIYMFINMFMSITSVGAYIS